MSEDKKKFWKEFLKIIEFKLKNYIKLSPLERKAFTYSDGHEKLTNKNIKNAISDHYKHFDDESSVPHFRNKKYGEDIGEWDTTEVTNMSGLFKDKYVPLHIANWNVDNVTNMSNMFENATFPDDFTFKNWNVDNVTNNTDMFKDSSNLTEDKNLFLKK